MRTQSQISAVALAAALLTIPQAAQAQLNLGISVGGGSSSGSGSGSGSGGISVDLGGSSGGSSSGSGSGSSGGGGLLGIDLGLGNSGGGSQNDGNLLDLDVDLLGTDTLDADIDVGAPVIATPSQPAPDTGNGSAPLPVLSEPLLGVRISALDDAARLDALLGSASGPALGDIDLDDAIDDTQVSIVDVSDLLGSDARAEIDAMLSSGTGDRSDLLEAIGASTELSAILDREGVAIDDVLSLYVGANGEAEVVVLDGVVDVAIGGDAETTPAIGELADLDIDLLTDDELAKIDLALLPDEAQRLEVILRLLETGNGTPSGGTVNTVDIIDLDALLGEQSLAEVDAVLGGEQDDFVLSADLLDALDAQGLSPEAVVAVRTDDAGNTQLFIDLGLGDEADAGGGTGVGGLPGIGGLPGVGDISNGLGDLADLDIDLLTDEELAKLDLTLLPNEEQRLEAIIRLLGNGSDGGSGNGTPSTGTGSGPIKIVDVDALLGDESIAELDVILNGDNGGTGGGNDIELSADILDLLDQQGISADAVIGIGSGPNGSSIVIIDAGLGNIADVGVEIGAGGNTGGGNTGGGNTGGGNTGGGNTGGGNTGGGSTGGGNTGGGNTAGGGTGGGGSGTAQNPPLVTDSGALTGPLPSALIDVNTVVASVACDVGIGELAAGRPLVPNEIGSVRRVELVQLAGCIQTLSQERIEELRLAVEANATLRTSIENAGLAIDTLVGGNLKDGQLTLYFEELQDQA